MNKKFFALLCIVLCVFVFSCGISAADPAPWDGTADTSWYDAEKTSFEIDTPEKLAGLAAIVNGTAEGIEIDSFAGKTITLTADLDLGGVQAPDGSYVALTSKNWTPIGEAFMKPFSGEFNGNGHNIANLYISSTIGRQGIFGFAGGNAKIKNLNIVSGSVTATSESGALLGFSHTSSSVIILNCSNAASVKGTYAVGGLVGALNYNKSYIANCYNSGTVQASSYGTGGVVGTLACNMVNCYNVGSVSNTFSTGRVGGVFGDVNGNPMRVSGCYNAGEVSTTGGSLTVMIGGVAGRGYDSSWSKVPATFENCFYLKTSETMFATGGDTSDRAGTAAKTEAELKASAEALGSGFLTDSDNLNNGYPILKWQKKVDGRFNYDMDETDGLDITDEGILNATADGFEVHLNHLLTYTVLGTADFTVTASVNGENYPIENLAVTVSSDETTTTVKFTFKTLPAETPAEYSVAYHNNPAKTLSFTTPASDYWLGYAASGFAGGDGSAENPYQIATAEQLAYFDYTNDSFENQFVVLTADIDMGGKIWVPRDFKGNFDGQGHTISNLNIKGSVKSDFWGGRTGFFADVGIVTTNAEINYIQNLTFDHPTVDGTGSTYTGTLAGSVGYSRIENCHVVGGKVENCANEGGLIGWVNVQDSKNLKTTVLSRCSFDGEVIGTGNAAGLVCRIYQGNTRSGNVLIQDCSVSGSVHTNSFAAGIFSSTGYMKQLTVDNCYVTADMIGSQKAFKVGGLVTGITYSGSMAIGQVTISDSVAAMSAVSDSGDVTTTSGRIIANGSDVEAAGKGTFTNTYALDSMTLNGVIPQESVNNGTNVSSATLSTKEFWSETLGYDFGENGNWIWNEETSRPEINKAKQAVIELTVTTQPKDAVIYNNRAAVLGAEVSGGTLGYTYQWQTSRYADRSFSDIEDAVNDTISLAKGDTFARNNYYFRCVITDNTGHTVTTDAAKLTVADAKFNVSKAREELVDYYNSSKTLDYAGEAFSLYAAGVSTEDYAFKIPTYYGYFAQNSSASNTNMIPYLYLDAYVRGTDVAAYKITGTSMGGEEDMIASLLNNQNPLTGYISSKENGWGSFADAPGLVLALDMYYAGADSWGNEEEGTMLGRNGAIEYLFTNLRDYTGGGKFFSSNTTLTSSLGGYVAQGDFVMLMARLIDDPVLGERAENAMYDVLQCMENLYDSGLVVETRAAARFVSAFIAAADVTDKDILHNHYLELAEEIMANAILPSVASDGSYCANVGSTGLTGKDETTAAVLLAIADYQNESAAFVTYNYEMPDENAVSRDLSFISFDNPVTGDVELPVVGRYGSEITWESSSPRIIDASTGKVKRPSEDTVVTLTATAVRGDASATQTFELNVKADADSDTDAVDSVLASLVVPFETYLDIELPGSIEEGVELTWTSSNEEVLSSEGKVTQPAEGENAMDVVLTATASKGNVTKSKEFTVTVLAETTDKATLAYQKTRNFYLNNRNISGYWSVFAAYAALGDYIQDPANGYTFTLAKPAENWYGVQYGATVMAIVAMGENPYNYNGVDWVELLKKNYGGMYAAPVYSQLGMNAAGADKSLYSCGPDVGLSLIKPSSMTMGIDIAGWAAVIAADHAGEEGVDEAVKTYVDHLKNMGVGGDGNINGCNYISTGCALMGFAGLMSAGYEDCDADAGSWVNSLTDMSLIDAVYSNNFDGAETISGYSTQAMVSICDYYNAKYNNGTNSWVSCRVNRDRLNTQIEKANTILENREQYDAASIGAIETALAAVNEIPEEELNEKIAGYGKEYYDLYDAVRYAKVLGQSEKDAEAANVVTEQINELPAADQITLDDEETVANVRAAYDSLTSDQKSYISEDTLAGLISAEEKLAELRKAADDEAAAAEVIEKINALPDEITLDDSDAVKAARSAYRNLTDDQKSLIKEETLDKLIAAEETIQNLEDHPVTPGIDVSVMTDVEETDWFYNDVSYVLANNIFKGMTETTFGPNVAMTRSMFVTVLGRYAGIEDSSVTYPSSSIFSDVKGSEYYGSHVKWASENGITVGVGNGMFAPDQMISRQDMATMMVRFAKVMNMELPDMDDEIFSDDSMIGDYAKEPVYRLKAAAILNGRENNNFDPKASCTRAEVAAVLHRFLTYDPSAEQQIDDSDAVIVSVEKFTLGQGYVIEPSVVKLEEGDTAADVILRVCEEKGIEVKTSNSSGTFYLAAMKDNDRSEAKIPEYITNAVAEAGGEIDGRSNEDWLGEFDYYTNSGWMFWVNNAKPADENGFELSAGQTEMKAGDIMRWQFTVYGIGADLGTSAGSIDALIDAANKDALTREIAVASKNQKSGSAYANALSVLKNMESTQEDVDAALAALQK